MSELFNAYNLQKKLKEQSIVVNKEQKDIFLRWKNVLEKKDKNETQLQTDFLNDIFGEVLGYSYKRGLEYYNLEKEQKTETDATTPDGILGFFSETEKVYRVIIELKSIGVNLEANQNRKNDKRTSIEQAFGYVSKYKGIQWVIVSNFKEIRFFSTYQGDYHSFLITDLEKNEEKQKEFLFLLSKNNLIGVSKEVTPLTKSFLEQDKKAQEVIKHDFYKGYKSKREIFITDVLRNNDINIDTALAKVQKLFDRLLFIRFCDDNNLINDAKKLIKDAKNWYDTLWNGLKKVFNFVDKGKLPLVDKFNGGLFANDEIFNNLKINEQLLEELIDFLNRYDFKNQITVNILGHIFEQSISDIETLKASLNNTENNKKQSIRKKDGIFYTPEYITKYIVKEAVGGWLNEKKQALGIYDIEEVEIVSSIDKYKKGKNPNEFLISKYKEYKNILENIKVLDPSCGSGAFLVEVFNFLAKEWIDYTQKLFNLGDKHEIGFLSGENLYKDILQKNIYGVDLNSESVQISKLSLWIKTAKKGTELTALDNNIKVGNSLIDDETIETNNYIDNYGNKISKAFNWQKEFPEVFATGGFDVVVGNPPYGVNFKEQHKEYLTKLDELVPDYESYIYFISKGLTLLNQHGKLFYIFPNTFLSNLNGLAYRRKELNNNSLINITNLSNDNTFESANVRTCICGFQKTKQDFICKISIYKGEFEIIKNITQDDLLRNCKNLLSFVSVGNIERELIDKINAFTKLSKFCDVSQGYIPYDKYRGQSEETIKNRIFHSNFKIDETYKVEIKGGDIKSYFVNLDTGKYVKYGKHLANPREQKYFINPRILISEITNNKVVSTYTDQECYNNPSVINVIKKHDDIEISLHFILTIINSKLISFYHKANSPKAKKGLFPKILINDTKNLPIPQISQDEQQPFIKKAQDMLLLNKDLSKLSNKLLDLLRVDLGISKITKKLESWYNLQDNEFFAEVEKQNKNLSLKDKSKWQNHFEEEKTKALELQNKISTTDNEIDTMVYALYGLNEEEIKIIEDFDI